MYEDKPHKLERSRKSKLIKIAGAVGAAVVATTTEEIIRRTAQRRQHERQLVNPTSAVTYRQSALALSSEGYIGRTREQVTMIAAIVLVAHPVNKYDLQHWLEDSEAVSPKQALAIIGRLSRNKQQPLIEERIVKTGNDPALRQLEPSDALLWAALPQNAEEYSLLHEYIGLLTNPPEDPTGNL
jgi:hypothetical protein